MQLTSYMAKDFQHFAICSYSSLLGDVAFNPTAATKCHNFTNVSLGLATQGKQKLTLVGKGVIFARVLGRYNDGENVDVSLPSTVAGSD